MDENKKIINKSGYVILPFCLFNFDRVFEKENTFFIDEDILIKYSYLIEAKHHYYLKGITILARNSKTENKTLFLGDSWKFRYNDSFEELKVVKKKFKNFVIDSPDDYSAMLFFELGEYQNV